MTPQPSRAVRWFQLLGVWGLYASFGLAATSLAPLVPLIESELDLSHAQMGIVMGAWQLVFIIAAVPCGILLDRLGSRWALVIGCAFVAGSMLARSFANDFWQLLAAVMLFGVGGPIVSSGAPKVVSQWFEGSDRGFAMGIYMTGPSIGGIVTLTLTNSVLLPIFDGDWRAVLQLWAGVTMVVAAVWFIVASLPGADQKDKRGASSPGIPHLQLVRNLLRQPAVRLVLAMSVGVFFFNHGLNNWLPELLRVGGMTLSRASYWAAIPTAVGIIGSLTIPRLATAGRRFKILLGLALAALVASLLLHSTGGVSLATGLMMQGIARSALMTVLVLTLVELPGIGERNAGTASGLFFSSAEVGGVLGPISVGLIYDASGDFAAALAVLSGVAVALAVGSVRLSGRARAAQP